MWTGRPTSTITCRTADFSERKPRVTGGGPPFLVLALSVVDFFGSQHQLDAATEDSSIFPLYPDATGCPFQ